MRGESMKVFTEMAGTTFEEIAKPFYETYKSTMKEKNDEAAALKAGLSAYDAWIEKTKESTYTSDKLKKQFEERFRDDPSVKMTQALNKIRDAFSQPKMIDALGKLANKLPVLADAIASLVDFIVEKPWLAAAGAVGLRAGMPFLGGMFGGGGAGGGGPGGGGPVRDPVTGRFVKGGGGGGGLGPAATGAASALIKLQGAAIAFTAGYQAGTAIYNKFIHPALEAEAKVRTDLAEQSSKAAIEARRKARMGGTAEKREAVQSLRERIKKMKGEELEIAKSDEQRIGSVVALFTDIKTPLERHREEIAKLEADVKKIQQSAKDQKVANEQATENIRRFGTALSDMTDEFGPGVTENNGSYSGRGTKKKGKPTPGAETPGG
jgi:hypothetical protein